MNIIQAVGLLEEFESENKGLQLSIRRKGTQHTFFLLNGKLWVDGWEFHPSKEDIMTNDWEKFYL